MSGIAAEPVTKTKEDVSPLPTRAHRRESSRRKRTLSPRNFEHLPLESVMGTQHREHTCQGLGQGHHVRLHAKMLVCPQLASPAQPTLHLQGRPAIDLYGPRQLCSKYCVIVIPIATPPNLAKYDLIIHQK